MPSYARQLKGVNNRRKHVKEQIKIQKARNLLKKEKQQLEKMKEEV